MQCILCVAIREWQPNSAVRHADVEDTEATLQHPI